MSPPCYKAVQFIKTLILASSDYENTIIEIVEELLLCHILPPFQQCTFTPSYKPKLHVQINKIMQCKRELALFLRRLSVRELQHGTKHRRAKRTFSLKVGYVIFQNRFRKLSRGRLPKQTCRQSAVRGVSTHDVAEGAFSNQPSDIKIEMADKKLKRKTSAEW